MFGGRLVWDKMFTGRLVGGRSIQAPKFVATPMCVYIITQYGKNTMSGKGKGRGEDMGGRGGTI
jgi:hypothetical protein